MGWVFGVDPFKTITFATFMKNIENYNFLKMLSFMKIMTKLTMMTFKSTLATKLMRPTTDMVIMNTQCSVNK